jgi:hypothetical protein
METTESIKVFYQTDNKNLVMKDGLWSIYEDKLKAMFKRNT